MEFSTYPMEQYPLLYSFPKTPHSGGYFGYSKLILHTILPKSVETVSL